MKKVFISSDNILSPIGFTSTENFLNLSHKISGIKKHENSNMSELPFLASLFDTSDYFFTETSKSGYTKFEQLLIASISNAFNSSEVAAADKKTILIISSTKGNIGLLETEIPGNALNNRIALHHSAKLVAHHFKFVNPPVVVSNACISGLLALITGMRLIQSGQYDNAVIAGADVISKFVLSGFQSFDFFIFYLFKLDIPDFFFQNKII